MIAADSFVLPCGLVLRPFAPGCSRTSGQDWSHGHDRMI